jgi:uncharacterized membrane-anchored protein YitT (DUF2179 family)
MENIRKLETTIASWYEKAPHLPLGGRKWLADNAWWLVLIGVVIGALIVFSVLSVSLLAGALLVGIGGVAGIAAGLLILFVLLWLALAIINIVLLAMAVTRLRAKEKKGWTFVFIVVLLNLIAAILHLLFDFEPTSFILSLLGSAISGYFLFEIREYFTATRVDVTTETRV